MELFPMMKSQNLRLASVRIDEGPTQTHIETALRVFDANLVGPKKYVTLYAKYADLMTLKAERDAESFLLEERTTTDMRNVRESFFHSH